jgi:dipeptidyl aminopeptidase/acylaminoacyl peptidase
MQMPRRTLSVAIAAGVATSLLASSGAVAQDASPAPLDAIRLVDQREITVEDSRIISMSPDGRWLVAARPAISYRRGELCVVAVETLQDRSCADLSGLGAGLRIEDVTWSPDGERLAFSEVGLQLLVDGDLWLMDAATGELTNLDDDGFEGRIPFPAGEEDGLISLPVNPAFSPDGTRIAFSRSILSGGGRGTEIAVVPAAGGAVEKLLTVDREQIGVVYFGIAWAPDGSQLYVSVQPQDRRDWRIGIWAVDADGSGASRLLVERYQETYGPTVLDVASDGRSLLIQDPEAFGRFGGDMLPVYAVADTESGSVAPIVPIAPGAPTSSFVGWAGFSPDGRSLLTVHRFSSPDHQVWVRAVGGAEEVVLVPDGLETAGPVDRGIALTWATNGTAFLTGGGRLDTGTLLTIEGGLPED